MLDTIFPNYQAAVNLSINKIAHGFKIYPYSQPHGRSLEIPRGSTCRFLIKGKILKESMKLNWNIPRCDGRVHSPLSSSNCMTFCMTFSSFPRPWVQLSVSKTQKPFLVLEYFLTLNSSTGTNSGVHQNACHLYCLITPL